MVKLNGSNDSVVNEPKMKGNIDNVKNLLFKYLSIINNFKIFFFNLIHFFEV